MGSSRKTAECGGERERREDPGTWGDCARPAPRPPQVKQNLLSVSYHIAQYTSIIADLRGEIQRLKCKIDEQGGRGQARGRLEQGDLRHVPGVCVGPREWEPSPAALPGGLRLLGGQAVQGASPRSGWAALGYSLNRSEPSAVTCNRDL